MSGDQDEERFNPFRMEELEVTLRIRDGKFVAESQSGPKSGMIELTDEAPTTRLTLKGPGSDEASVALSGPELSNFRSIIDAALSSILTNQSDSGLEDSSLSSGYQPLQSFDDGFGLYFDAETLAQLGLLDEQGEIPGGSRQVQCTVLPNGTAIVNLVDSSESGFQF